MQRSIPFYITTATKTSGSTLTWQYLCHSVFVAIIFTSWLFPAGFLPISTDYSLLQLLIHTIATVTCYILGLLLLSIRYFQYSLRRQRYSCSVPMLLLLSFSAFDYASIWIPWLLMLQVLVLWNRQIHTIG